MIAIKGLVKSFGLKRAIDHLDLEVAPGDILGIVGPDGAGKTTLLRMICGIIRPDSGTILIMGNNPESLNRKRLGYMPQQFSLYPDLTISENLDFFGSMYNLSRNEIQIRTAEILESTGLAPFINRLASQLSGGMKQKLSLTCSLITRPTILILDEPTYGVDPLSRREFWRLLYNLNDDGHTIIFTTPYMDEAELCKKVSFINEGKISWPESPAILKKTYPYSIVEVTGVKNPALLLNTLPEVINFSSYADKYRLVLDNSMPIDYLKSYFYTREGELSFKEVSPTMEDIFVYLAEKGAD